MSLVDNVREAATFVGGKTRLRPQIGIVLGSGLGAFADSLAGATSIPYEEVPHFPRSSVVGHKGRLVAGTFESVPVYVMSGRVHAYEGYSASDVTFPARVLITLGARTLVLTNRKAPDVLNLLPVSRAPAPGISMRR